MSGSDIVVSCLVASIVVTVLGANVHSPVSSHGVVTWAVVLIASAVIVSLTSLARARSVTSFRGPFVTATWELGFVSACCVVVVV